MTKQETIADNERNILGAVLLDNSLMSLFALQPNNFLCDAHAWIWLAMTELHRAGKEIDYVSLVGQLRLAGQLEVVGGIVYLTSLTDGRPHPDLIREYIKAQRKASVGVAKRRWARA